MTISEISSPKLEVGNLEWVDVKYTEKDGTEKQRSVSRMKDLNPDLEIPAGTSFGNGRHLEKPMTNLELMKKGKAPFVPTYDEKGNISGYCQVELHHTEQSEISGLYKFMSGVARDGSVMEISSETHDKYKTTLHLTLERGTSWRYEKIWTTDKNGIHVRKVIKTEAVRHYAKFKGIYWQARAAEYEKSRGVK